MSRTTLETLDRAALDLTLDTVNDALRGSYSARARLSLARILAARPDDSDALCYGHERTIRLAAAVREATVMLAL